MPVLEKNTVEQISLSKKQEELVEKANLVYKNNFGNDAWFGRCVFLSWYCSKGTCDFCFRSTQKHKISFADNARRTKKSVFSEAIISKTSNWKLEFLTGGYDVYSFDEILHVAKICSEIFKEKIWINLGVLTKEELKTLTPYVEGVVASLETVDEKLHKKTCPDKEMEPYLEMLKYADELGLKKGMTIVLGLGESLDDYNLAKKIIQDYSINRVTYYALRPVRGTPYTNGPEPEHVIEWIAKTRIDFPKIEIMAGTAVSRIPEIKYFLKAGANGFTKLPATRIYGSELAHKIIQEVKDAGRNLRSEFLKINKDSWNKTVKELSISDEEKAEILSKLEDYEKMMTKHK